jgi:xanthine/CO dehydrogenase XdhC/CoxF family maturation factor
VRELRDIAAAFDALGAGEDAVLATVVRVEGSTYRRAGARALLLPDERVVGLLSGGCLEGDLLERARAVRAAGAPERVRYDHRGEDDLVWGLGLGCAGLVDVLLQPVSRSAPGPLPRLREALSGEGPVFGAVVVAREGASAPTLGAEVALSPAERFAVEECGLRARTRWREGRGHRIELLEECIAPPTRLLVFGAGPDVVPVVRLAHALGFAVRVADPRPGLARPERFPEAEAVLEGEPEEVVARAGVTPDCVALVMTHHYLHDRAVLGALLAAPPRYVGVLGPRRRTEDLLRDLSESGVALAPDALERVHGPAGLDVGADGAEEIALALLAEVTAVLAGRRGGPLRERKGPIHEPAPRAPGRTP